MRFGVALLVLLLTVATAAIAATPGVDISVGVTRYSEYKLTDEQTQILDEATKLSAACRVFNSLYGRWPKDVGEIEARTSGIDFSVFNGQLHISKISEGIEIEIFDGKNMRQLRATADGLAPIPMRDLAQDPNFKIRVRPQPSS